MVTEDEFMIKLITIKQITSLFIFLITLSSYAFLPPIETRSGIKVEIKAFPQKIERIGKNPYDWPLGVTEITSDEPVTFPVIIENKTNESISGHLDVWINEDWNIKGLNEFITLAPDEEKTFIFTATAKPHALNALYPVHARFTSNGVKKEEAPHPIAIFKFEASTTPLLSAGKKQVHH